MHWCISSDNRNTAVLWAILVKYPNQSRNSFWRTKSWNPLPARHQILQTSCEVVWNTALETWLWTDAVMPPLSEALKHKNADSLLLSLLLSPRHTDCSIQRMFQLLLLILRVQSAIKHHISLHAVLTLSLPAYVPGKIMGLWLTMFCPEFDISVFVKMHLLWHLCLVAPNWSVRTLPH